jgi:hypothetical protein
MFHRGVVLFGFPFLFAGPSLGCSGPAESGATPTVVDGTDAAPTDEGAVPTTDTGTDALPKPDVGAEADAIAVSKPDVGRDADVTTDAADASAIDDAVVGDSSVRAEPKLLGTTCPAVFDTPVIARDGRAVMTKDCDAEDWSIRELPDGPRRAAGALAWPPIAVEDGFLVGYQSGGVALLERDGSVKSRISDLRVPQNQSARIAVRAGQISFGELRRSAESTSLVFHTSRQPTPIESARFATANRGGEVLVSDDQTRIAMIEGNGRLFTAETTPGAKVEALETKTLEPRWLESGSVGSGALLTDLGGRLHWVDLAKPTSRQISDERVVLDPAKVDRTAYARVFRDKVYFVTGPRRSSTGPSTGAAQMHAWEPGAPDQPSKLLFETKDFRKDSFLNPPMTVTPDGQFLLVDLEPSRTFAGTVVRAWSPTLGDRGEITQGWSIVFAPAFLGPAQPFAGDKHTLVDVHTATRTTFTGARRYAPSRDGARLFLLEWQEATFAGLLREVRRSPGAVGPGDLRLTVYTKGSEGIALYPVLDDAVLVVSSVRGTTTTRAELWLVRGR